MNGHLATKIQYGIAALLALAAIAVPDLPATAAQHHTIDLEAVDQVVTDGLDRTGIPGAAIAITRGDQVLHVRGYGHGSDGMPVTEHTPFRIASLSKAITSLAVMQLVDAGQLALDDTVYAHLSEFRIADPRGADITIRQLLNQTSGLADRRVPDISRPQPATLAEATASLCSARLVADPGTEFNYHNPNYQVAARLIEVISGEAFDDYLRDHVFHPAGMMETLDTAADNKPVAGLTNGHILAFGQPIATPAPGHFVEGAGGVVSTAADMAQWLILQTGGGLTANGTRLLSAESMAQMHTSNGQSGYALGWSAYRPEAAPARLQHTGNLLTFSAATAILPDSRIGVTLMFNGSAGLLLEQTAIFHEVLNIIEGGHPDPGALPISGRLLDSVVAVLAFTVILLAAQGVAASRRWAARAARSPVLAAARLLPLLGVLVLVASLPKLAGWFLDGRDFDWATIVYSWPTMAGLAAFIALAAAVTLSARAWHLDAIAPHRRSDRFVQEPARVSSARPDSTRQPQRISA